MIGDIVWSDGRSWTKSTNGFWSGYYPGEYKNLNDGWFFTDLKTLELSVDFRWIVKDAVFLLEQPIFENAYTKLSDQLKKDTPDFKNLANNFKSLVEELLDVGVV